MESNVWTKTVSGNVPDFGAIFMSNRTTIKECFERKLLGLPSTFSSFVKNVKAGMILFLFEFEQRKLYGVFQAISDGAMDIVPHAYRSSGKLFTAQVRFTVIWNCYPLSERDFRDAIGENYFTAYKFNFGLSKDQVHRLLLLFDSKKVRVQKSLRRKNEKNRRSKFSDNVNPLVNSGRLGPEKVNSMDESQQRLSSVVVPSLYAGTSKFPHATMAGASNGLASVHEIPICSIGAPDDLPLSENQLSCLQKEQENADISSYSASTGLGDYIPLSSPERTDSAETGIPFPKSGDLEKNQMDSATSDCWEDLSFSEACLSPTPFRPRGSKPSAASFGPDRDLCNGYQRDQVRESENHLGIKSLYSDTPNRRTSVFSRMNLISKAAVTKNEEDSKVDKSVQEIMEKLHWRHDNWTKTWKAKDSAKENGDISLNKRRSVFSRLDFAKGSAQDEEVSAKVDKYLKKVSERFLEKKRRGRQVFIKNRDDGEDFNIVIQVGKEEESQDEEDPKDTWSTKRMEEQIPLQNIKRKCKMLKIEHETEGIGCNVVLDGCLSEKQRKKRRLAVPMSRDDASDVKTEVSDSCLPSQESFSGKETGITCEVLIRGERIEDNENGLTQVDIAASSIYSTICESNSGKKGQGSIYSNSKDKGQGSTYNKSEFAEGIPSASNVPDSAPVY